MWDLQKLFLRHAREIDRFLRRRGHSPETAADLTQDTFLRVMTAAARRDGGNPRAYLHRVARNLSIDLRRRECRMEHVSLPEEEIHAIADPSPSPETAAYDRERLRIVESAIAELPERTRRAFQLHRLGGRTLSEVAGELGLSTSRTWVLIRKAYLHLRARLAEAGDDPA
ncbi:RNA polymerase sigma factor [Kaustia mangrovi]|uniref:RNA polymerase sigma factor n=1 Tax=Kaustia mangrovi TaxID=2593653 RepID=A0A7S8HCF1_9HYPH|nr:RNA polymerase sigma factor [Kaustia mangrovi]QPC43545.1 RNA polymerase sigma factor [Kaustia mangrovi]